MTQPLRILSKITFAIILALPPGLHAARAHGEATLPHYWHLPT